ncbi:hypothetical protein APF79_00225 [bacterium BRH_c32]|nr:MAG: hypothetical protein APF79_00225 [bacterium BRH_c32]
MKNRLYKLFLLLPLILAVTFSGCSKDDNPTEPSTKDKLIGVWTLTKVTVKFSGTPIVLTPEQAGVSGSLNLKSDNTFIFNYTSSDGSQTGMGTYSFTDTQITLKDNVSGETTLMPYKFTANNKVEVEQEMDYQGMTLPATIEFTKQ